MSFFIVDFDTFCLDGTVDFTLRFRYILDRQDCEIILLFSYILGNFLLLLFSQNVILSLFYYEKIFL